ncbi:DgyrCDS13373 [Dimorphilus gyrociliatus]|uniref:DgyrCDS13373 n=1 Tax=Dimorphilus gyrociliatus TaxID=2664684 RepID=A0A7I8WAH4_9ANNE|nr:DgyrCDS13373 [Dimorphilus gyrociliatus]
MAANVLNEKNGQNGENIAFEVILKPATPNGPRKTPKSSPRPLSQEEIKRKLLDAADRRKSVEAEKLKKIQKLQERGEEAREKVQELNNSFQAETQRTLEAKMGALEENRNAQILALQNKLRERIKKVEDVRQASEKYTKELAERIEKKLEVSDENRKSQMKNMLDRLKEHEKHVQEVLETSQSVEQEKKEKMILKMNEVLQNKNNLVQQMLDKLRDHDKRVEEVRQRVKLLRSFSEEDNKENSTEQTENE